MANEYITLMGAEDVRSAVMRQVAEIIDLSLKQHENFLREWLTELQQTLATPEKARVPNHPVESQKA